MAKNIEKTQSDSARLHEEILELAKEHSDIIEHADDYRERWQTVFPDGMLEELCMEFQCCPALVLIALEILDAFNLPFSLRDCWKQTQRTDCITGESITYPSLSSAIQRSNINDDNASATISKAISKNKPAFGYYWNYIVEEMTSYDWIVSIQRCLVSNMGIYKIEYPKQHLCYVGQTMVSFRERWQEHLKHASNHTRSFPLYQAFDEYDVKNFEFSIIEILPDTIEKKDVLEREKFYIEYFQSQCKNGGLNVDKPKWNAKLNEKTIELVFQSLLDGATNKEITEKYPISKTLVALMRNGTRHRHEGITYPILSRKDQDRLETYQEICQLLVETSHSLIKVAELTGVGHSTVVEAYNHRIPKSVLTFLPELNNLVFIPRRHTSHRTKITIEDIQYYKSVCISCHKPFLTESRNTKYCSFECRHKSRRKTERPSNEKLKSLIRTTSFTELGKQYDVTDNTVRKWCRVANLPSSSKEIASYTNDEWENEIWNDPQYKARCAQVKSKPDYEQVLQTYLATRSKDFTIGKCQITPSQMDYALEKYEIQNSIQTIKYCSTCCYLEEKDLYFRSATDAATWVFENFPHDSIPAKNPKSLSTRISSAFRANSPVTLTLPAFSSSSNAAEPSTFTFLPIPQDTFYSVIQHHHVVSYAFDPKWCALIEDPALLPDFISLDELPWVAEFKKFYSVD